MLPNTCWIFHGWWETKSDWNSEIAEDNHLDGGVWMAEIRNLAEHGGTWWDMISCQGKFHLLSAIYSLGVCLHRIETSRGSDAADQEIHYGT